MIADDHPLVRSGVRWALQAQGAGRYLVVAEAGSAAEVDSTVRRQQVGLVVLDLDLGEDNGLDVLARLSRLDPAPAVVVLTMHDDAHHVRAALQHGALGYVLKDNIATSLLQAMDAATDGRAWIDPRLGPVLAAADSHPRLSEREVHVLELLVDGHTSPEIARRLHLSVRSVDGTRARLRAIFEVRTAAELLAAARGHPQLPRR